MTKLALAMTALVLVVGATLLSASPSTSARSARLPLTLSAPGIAFQKPNALLVAVRLNNIGRGAVLGVKIDSAQLGSARLLSVAPRSVGKIGAGRAAIVQANFRSNGLIQRQRYRLAIRGSFGTTAGKRAPFLAQLVVVLPPAAPGKAPLRHATASPHETKGAPFPARPPRFDRDRNGSRWTVPKGRSVPGRRSARTAIKKSPLVDPPVDFEVNNGLGFSGSTTAEPSGAVNAGRVVFASSNWYAAYSNDNGSTFTQVNPTTIFPSDAIGFCCDQIVQYAPSVDRFIWLLQGNNGFRLASASPATLLSSGATAWTYWNLPSSLFGQPTGTGVDYPDLSVGDNSLYLSWDVGWPSCPKGCNSGVQVTRTSLAGIQAGGTISLDYTNPPDSSMVWGGHLTQDTGNEIFWAGHNSSSQMRVFSLAEGSNTYFWRDVNISSWAQNTLSSTTPDGRNWFSWGFPSNAVIGSTRVGSQIWFAWDAGTDKNFPQAHVEMVTLNRNNNFSRIQQVQIWNPSYAFGYPALATNACTREVGMSFEYGGGGNYENHVVGFWGDFIAYITTGSNVGTGRFGDYVTIRQAPATKAHPGNLLAAFGYGLNSAAGGGTTTDVHYVLFGRSPSSCR
ncbi:MAG TPA: hypothetical protein VE596_00355 [Gaiellaceae bacterium]|jgi:hypothetical protein|nr:hypothetical protein [Gaiellaceae bacterium]